MASPIRETTIPEALDPREWDAALRSPSERLTRRGRNKLCVVIIAFGLVNFLVYTLVYAVLGGDAPNGSRRVIERPGGTHETVYFVGGHYLRSLTGEQRAVSKEVWIYSYLHSISVLATSGAMVISMLLLARPHIVATMRDSWVSGPIFVNVFGTIVVVVTLTAMLLFAWGFFTQVTGR